MSPVLLEVCVDSLGDAAIARDAGADRIELCAALELGGLTPSFGLTAKAVDLGIPVFAMIRPHAADFIYSESDVSCMLADIEVFRSLGVSGFVFGALNKQKCLDDLVLRSLISACGGLPMTLHRAFDRVVEPMRALEDAIELGFDRILTSGGAESVQTGLPLLEPLFSAADDRIIIMPGGGVSAATISGIMVALSIVEIHASCKKALATSADGQSDLNVGRMPPQKRYGTDADAIRKLIQILNSN